ncbi:S41 family peptidase [Streptodolium elevatio]|uniref:S41 family peptidase n=1 Tax=Streptodolium elevatio TaxID=3157996 RepID=A0ABV3DFW1_9ACTN
MTSGRVRRRAALALAFGAALTTGAATGAWDGVGIPGPRPAEARPRVPQQLPPTQQPTQAPRGAPAGGALDGADLDADHAQGLLAVLDDRWAAYYPPGTAADHRERVDGTFPGVGLTVRQAEGAVHITYVTPGGPANRAGLVAGDTLAAVDSVPAAELGVAGVVARLRGPVGTTVTLTVASGGPPREVVVTRELLTGADVRVEPLDAAGTPVPVDGLVRIRVAGFGRGTADQVRTALAAKPAGVLLDLRGNPGGLIDEAASVASAFLRPGPVVGYDDGSGVRRELGAAAPPGDTATPVVVLVDGGSASAAEVVAAALRDRGRAVVVGSTTYGKGSVQAPTVLADGGVLELTVGGWYSPDGRSVEGRGVAPDIPAPSEAADARAREVLADLAEARGS